MVYNWVKSPWAVRLESSIILSCPDPHTDGLSTALSDHLKGREREGGGAISTWSEQILTKQSSKALGTFENNITKVRDAMVNLTQDLPKCG